MAAEKIFADDTGLPVLDPGRGRTKTGRFWCYAIDDRPWCGPAPPAAAYVYAEDRKGARPTAHLANFRGIVQVDGYTGFGQVVKERADASVKLAFCWVHARRGFFEVHASTKSPIAAEALARIATLLCNRGRNPRPAGCPTPGGAAGALHDRLLRRCMLG